MSKTVGRVMLASCDYTPIYHSLFFLYLLSFMLQIQLKLQLLELAAEERRSRSSIDRRRKGSSFVGQHQVANGLLSHGSPNDMARALKHLRERTVVIRKQMSKTYGFDVSQYARPTKGEEKQAKLPSDYNDAFTSLERNQQFYSHRSGGLGRRNV